MESWPFFNETLLLICRLPISFPWSWLPLRERRRDTFTIWKVATRNGSAAWICFHRSAWTSLQVCRMFLLTAGSERVTQDSTLVSWTCPDRSHVPRRRLSIPRRNASSATRPWRKPDPANVREDVTLQTWRDGKSAVLLARLGLRPDDIENVVTVNPCKRAALA